MPKALTPEAPQQTKIDLQKMLEAQPATAIASGLRGMALRQDTSTVLSNTTLPVLIITGSNDTLISPEQSSKMHSLTKNSKLVEIKNAAHLSSLEQPKDWNKAVVDMFYKK